MPRRSHSSPRAAIIAITSRSLLGVSCISTPTASAPSRAARSTLEISVSRGVAS
jgi:hypothetical protein